MAILSAREQMKLEILVKVLTGLMTSKTAALLLEVDARTFRRYLKAYRERDILSVKHGNCLKRPHNKTNDEIKKDVLELIKDKYYDFNVLHLQEKLREEGFKIKREPLESGAMRLVWLNDQNGVDHTLGTTEIVCLRPEC
jgi:transposase